MTANGYENLQTELKKLLNEDRPNIIEAIAEARSHGDLSENAEYQYAKEQQSLIEGKIQELESTSGLAEIIDVSQLSGKEIKFGATIEIEDNDSGIKSKYSPTNFGNISYFSSGVMTNPSDASEYICIITFMCRGDLSNSACK